MRENSWPALRGWADIPDRIGTRRAVYGKVHRAPTDYRWIAWSADFGTEPPRLERELALGSEEPTVSLECWRCSPESGAFAAQYYPSRAFDAAGRPARIEKQILAPAGGSSDSIPPAALAFLLLPEAAKMDDTIWWDSWRDPRWASLSHYLPIRDDQVPTLSLGDLDERFEQGLRELFEAVEREDLENFYAQVAASAAPALLMTKTAPLTPLAMAALLLPLDRERTERVSIAGGTLSQSIDPRRYSEWTMVVCEPGLKIPQVTITEVDRSMAAEMVGLLRQGLEHRGSLPVPMSPGGNFLRQYMESAERWISPGAAGGNSLMNVGPWPIVRNPAEARILRQCVRDYVAAPTATEPSARRHLETKADLLRALLLVLCPGVESRQAANVLTTGLIPALFFIGRIERRDWEEVVASYGQAAFTALVLLSLDGCKLSAMQKPVLDWLRTLSGDSTSADLRAFAAQMLDTLQLRKE